MTDERQEAQQAALARRADELRLTLQGLDPTALAARSGAVYENGILRLALFDQPIHLVLPDLEIVDGVSGKALPTFIQALLLYYLVTADGTPPAGEWVSFADLPNGRIYAAAFQGYSGDVLVNAFGLDVDAFCRACESCHGSRLDLGECAYLFQALPRLPLAVTYWRGDEDFPSASKILFDVSAYHYIPIDACAILGGMLARKLCSARVMK